MQLVARSEATIAVNVKWSDSGYDIPRVFHAVCPVTWILRSMKHAIP